MNMVIRKHKKIYGSEGAGNRHIADLIKAGCVYRRLYRAVFVAAFFIFLAPVLQAQLPWSSDTRADILLDNDWSSVADSSGSHNFDGFEKLSYRPHNWKVVNVPHNWDDYGGYIRKKHGNRHGDAWYRKYFDAPYDSTKSCFLFFEGVSSYATVYLNGKLVGQHSGGRTGFSVNITSFLNASGKKNLLAVYVQHPSSIRDLPWVCGGCSEEIGFSEGSQPMGIFRPVHLIETGQVRIIPFGVHIYNDTTVSERSATLFWETSLSNDAKRSKDVVIRQRLLDRNGRLVSTARQRIVIGDSQQTISGSLRLAGDVKLWSLASPYLYQLQTSVIDISTRKVLDEVSTPYGIRWIKWPDLNSQAPRQFLLNGKPVFINGIAGYEHALGKSHAFTAEEIATRVAMIRAMGFNAFRDAHQPHNLRFQYYWDQEGLLWWPQFSAHIWFDTPAFRKNFLRLLKDWVLERRNSPSNIMWGLQNESKLPADFARQCVALIRSLDPTASSQRLITTCNGGEGTDWNVSQNWSGTYGGNPDTYSEDLKKDVLVGEYGGWRTVDLHSEGGFRQDGPYSIESWCALLEKKIRLAYAVKDSVCGEFLWLFNSHDNPGRQQAAEGYRDLDRIGPVNYKGILTAWEEPTEAFYLYAANFTRADTAPMVHIAGHDWQERWTGINEPKDITIYSNCDSVVLFNGKGQVSLGGRTRGGIGTHFSWKGVSLRYNQIYAVGYYNGNAVCSDEMQVNNLPAPPFPVIKKRDNADEDVLAPVQGYQYVYRYNCGAGAYTDHYGNVWSADRNCLNCVTGKEFGSVSWTADYKGLPAYFASQRSVNDPVKETSDDQLFQRFRYGRDKLKFIFPVTNGRYIVQLFFIEPWWGKGSHYNCNRWRDFDVAINGKIVLPHFDIFKEAGSLRALKKEIPVEVNNGQIVIDFPNTYSGQAVISAIAIAKKTLDQTLHKKQIPPVANSPAPILSAIRPAEPANGSSNRNATGFIVQDWLNTGDEFDIEPVLKPGITQPYNSAIKDLIHLHISSLPAALFGAQWLALKKGYLKEATENKWKATGDLKLYVGLQNKDSAEIKKLEGQGFANTLQSVLVINSKSEMPKKDSLILLEKDLKTGDVLFVEPWWSRSLIAFKPASQMQPPFDQKPEFTFGIKDADGRHKGKVVQRDNKDCLLFKEAGLNALSWPFVTGVADFHSFQVKYAYEGTDSLRANLTLTALDGTLLASKQIWLTPTRKGKWNSSELVTPTMINAGHYQLKISWEKDKNPLKAGDVYLYNMKLR
ncbi:Beta-galactosidase/beta-glucuronidase [Arachidicoccus rhizosphaerae]|uniref:Beta-galactosidase/beta-glucuronidase n=2 Tax=Arachidicoccus rhizosphaerae TaxID=551991 RepID=A0A1H3X112_9BACT|nr:Beta-galactosidase/beta-glucuronidase [Arachidicoccus rhizosphaerae]